MIIYAYYITLWKIIIILSGDLIRIPLFSDYLRQTIISGKTRLLKLYE